MAVGDRANWHVTGKFDVTYPGQKKKVEDFDLSFVAKSKADALKQAKSEFDFGKRAHPEVKYENLRNLNAKPV